MELVNTLVGDTAGEVAVGPDVMHHVGDILQGVEHAVMQVAADSERHGGGKQDRAGQYAEGEQDKVANQAGLGSQMQLANLRTVVHDRLCNRLGKQRLADQIAGFVIATLRHRGPASHNMLFRIPHLCCAVETPLTERRERIGCGGGIMAGEGKFQIAAHGRARQL